MVAVSNAFPPTQISVDAGRTLTAGSGTTVTDTELDAGSAQLALGSLIKTRYQMVPAAEVEAL